MYMPYVISLLDSIKVLHGAGIEWEYLDISGDSYVDRAKNSLVDKFLKSDCTHLFIIDSDLGWDVEGFAKVIKASHAGLEVVGGAFPNKNNWKTFGVVPLSDKDGNFLGLEQNGFRLIEVMMMPGGFVLYSREAFDRVKLSISTYIDTGAKSEEDKKIIYYEFFNV